MAYAGPAVRQEPPVPPPTSEAQRVFDTVVGPNVRLGDNLVQLAAAGAGVAVGALVAWVFAPPGQPGVVVLGGIGGAIAGVFISGAVIGVVRLVKAIRRR